QGGEEVKQVLEEGLETYLQDLYAPKGCACNACKHSYAGKVRIDRHATVQGTLRIWASAKVNWKDQFTAGTDVVPIYAEFRKEDGQTILTKLRWQKDTNCMKFSTLMQK
ncbi:MAG: hypothetical protein AAF399_19315, partial [Bacteroidota bacterium]